MKKYLFILSLLLLFIGCGKKNEIICTNNSSIDDVDYTAKVTLEYEDNKVIGAKAILEFGNSADKQKVCNLYENVNKILKGDEKIEYECKENTIEFSSYDSVLDINYEESTKDEFVENLKNEGYTCKS